MDNDLVPLKIHVFDPDRAEATVARWRDCLQNLK